MLLAISELIELFSSVEGSERLELLVGMGDRLPPLPEPYRDMRDAGLYMIHECQSPVFFFVEVVEAKVRIHADVAREAPVARGFAALLLETFDGIPVQRLGEAPGDLLKMLGLDELLSMQRRRGLTAIYRRLLDSASEVRQPRGSRTDSSSVTAIVLAAGASKRMGAQNKLLLDYGGRPLVDHTVETVLEAGIDDVVVVIGYEGDRVRNALADRPVRFAENSRYSEGMTTSIHAGVLRARHDSAGYMICPADLPLIDASEYEHLVRRFRQAFASDERSIIVPCHAGHRGNPVILSALYRPEILAYQDMRGCRGLVEQHSGHVVRVEMETDHILIDVDTLEDWSIIRRG